MKRWDKRCKRCVLLEGTQDGTKDVKGVYF